MENDKEVQQQGPGSGENLSRKRHEQFNEFSELSLEERMAVADQIGVPVQNADDAAETGAVSGRDEAAGAPDDGRDEEIPVEETDR